MAVGPNHNASTRLLSVTRILTVASIVLALAVVGQSIQGESEPASPAMPTCTLNDRFFENEVWAKVGERTCLRCHNPKGDAAESDFILAARNITDIHDVKWIQQNCDAFRSMAKATEGDQSRLLAKVSGGLDHGGGAVLKPDSTGYKILERYVRRVNPKTAEQPSPSQTADDSRPFFEGVTRISPQRLLRRVTLSLAGRLPKAEEQAAVATGSDTALDPILDAILKEDAFYLRLKEGFNDIFLTTGIEDNAETLLSYDHFEKTRLWYDKHDLNHLPEADRQKARWKLADVYRESLLREPLELITHIVRNDRSFTELATADYIMVSPYTARGYGIFDDINDQFKNPDDPFEYIPAKLKALKSREGKTQESVTGLYPHAGFLSMFHYLRRYPSTETNRNRLRARMFYQHFLGIDIMQLAPRSTDASAVAAKYKVPTMEASDCVVCHKTIDPVAGIFQDFNFEGNLGPRKGGWYQDMFQAGYEGLAGRLPKAEEQAAVATGSDTALDPILDAILKEDAFYLRLKEGFNDIFLTTGIEDNAETLLSYDHFEKTRLWYDKHDLNHLPEADRQKARWKLADVYRESLLREPLELITHIVRNDRSFTELATADYIMVSPYTARGYGIFDDINDQFKNPDDPFEYIPAKLKALKSREGKTQESVTGLYPHAGFLSMFHYLRRYPSTETNRNRLRARMFYQHFLGIDIMQLAPRSTDASAVAAKYKVPTMEASDCVVCHKTIDPVAGIFQDFNFEGNLGPRKGGWYQDMFQAGYEGEDMPATERWRAQQWLAERAVKDPRFPIAMVEHVYYILMGRKVLQAPEDIDDVVFSSRRRAYLEQRRMIEAIAKRFAESNFNLKVAFKAMIATDFYQADGLETIDADPGRRAELDDLGIVRLLSPEQLERKIHAIFGKRWGRLNDAFQVLYGGIDSITVTERNGDPSGAMGAIQRLMANDVSCYHVARDFRLEPNQRLLFPNIERDVVPGDEAADLKIRQTMVALHTRLLGREYPLDHPEVERTFQLFAGVIADANARGKFEPKETYFCGGREEFRADDPHYTLRSWRAVVTYLLRQHDFLYE